MKRMILLALLMGLYSGVRSQAYTSTTDFQKNTVQCVIIDMPFSKDLVNTALEEKFRQWGYKSKESKGYDLYREVELPEFGGEAIDLYFLVDRKSRKDKGSSIITLVMSKVKDEYVTQGKYPALIEKAKSFLNSFSSSMPGFSLDQQISSMDEAYQANEKKLKDLEDEADDLQKKKKKIEKEIEENEKTLSSLRSDMEQQKQALEKLRLQRGQ